MSPRPQKTRNPLSKWWNAHRKNDVSEQAQENIFLPYESQARLDYEQELHEMPVDELCKAVLGEDTLARLNSYRLTRNEQEE